MKYLLLAALLLGTSARAAELTVFAASSLTDAFAEIGRAFEDRTGTRVRFQFAGSQTLRTQLENGARADVYASANTAQYDPLVQKNLLEPGRVLARNRLTVIAARGRGVNTLRDLARPGLKLVLGDRNVPVGSYSRQALERLSRNPAYGPGFSSAVLRNVVSEETNVRQVALKVALGEADAGMVYVTDLTPELRGKVQAVYLPSAYNPPTVYPIGVLRAANTPQAARAFVDFVRSSAGQGILRKWGFLPAR